MQPGSNDYCTETNYFCFSVSELRQRTGPASRSDTSRGRREGGREGRKESCLLHFIAGEKTETSVVKPLKVLTDPEQAPGATRTQKSDEWRCNDCQRDKCIAMQVTRQKNS